MGNDALQRHRDPAQLLRRAQKAQARGDDAAATRLFEALLRHDPENFDALHGLGQVHARHRRLDTALTLVQAALKNDRSRADGFASLGLIFYRLRRLPQALASFAEGLRLDPDDVTLRNGRGVVLLELGRPDAALADFEYLLARAPDDCDTRGNYGNALLKLNRPAQALAAYDRALAARPDNAQLLTNRAVALRRLDRPQEARISASRALLSRPDFAEARFVEAIARLTLGDFSGWRGYEARWAVGNLPSQRRNFTAPRWLDGEPLAGKTVLLHAEQGFGDTLQFVRYAPLLVERGATVILEVQRELVRLLSGLPGVAAVIARGEALPAFDLHCPLLSLPLAFSTAPATIPAQCPYLTAPAAEVAAWRARLPCGLRSIGIAWSGDPTHDNDLNRSIGLAILAPLFDIPGVNFVSLQQDVRPDDQVLVQGLPELSCGGVPFRDFAETAAVITALDAVIAVDSAVAHLAGALGKPLFLLLPFAADFRWLRERRDSPWYPSARLYRQPQFGNWEAAVAALARDLGSAVSAAKPRELSA
jgi:tetratricopeptide (TPR) repeat protein